VRLLKVITRCLAEDLNEGIFCTSQSLPSNTLTLEVKDYGKVKLPVLPKAAKNLIEHAKPAKYGFKDKTLYDPEVRNVWEIQADAIKVCSEKWKETLTAVLKKMAFDLNIPKGSTLEPYLHNMVIYGPGQFFAAHQDSEKIPGMVATLVIVLPSNFRGGRLVIEQHGTKKEFGAAKEEHISLIAFYADCHHQVEPVKSGYRVALTYNLVMHKAEVVSPTDSAQELTNALKEYFTAKTLEDVPEYKQNYPRWLVFLLDHQYTQDALNWKLLKGSDRDYVGKLLAAAEILNLEAYLVLADIQETWDAEEEYSGSYFKGHKGKSVGKIYSESDINIRDLINDECTLNHWIDRDGNAVPFGQKYVSDSMICWAKSTSEFDPFETNYEGYQGNYGNTVDKWYHRAAIVLWPKNIHFNSLIDIDPSLALKTISKLLKKNLQEGHNAIDQILPQIEKLNFDTENSIGSLLEIAYIAQDQALAARLTSNISLPLISKANHDNFVRLFEQYGEDWILKQLQQWGKPAKGWHRTLLLVDFELMIAKLKPISSRIVNRLLDYQLEKIIANDKCADGQSILQNNGELAGRLKSLEEFVGAAQANIEMAESALRHALVSHYVYSPIALGTMAASICERISDNSTRHILADFLKEVRGRLKIVAEISRSPDDWSIMGKPTCSCEDCKNLTKFLQSGIQQKLIWPLAKLRRQHIHQVIGNMEIPVTHVTKREGSPQKLILTKTLDLFKQHKKLQKEAEVLLQRLS
jgi:hypothetical protein